MDSLNSFFIFTKKYLEINKQEIDWTLFLAFFMCKRKVIYLNLSYRTI
jgi:hypothetical protein